MSFRSILGGGLLCVSSSIVSAQEITQEEVARGVQELLDVSKYSYTLGDVDNNQPLHPFSFERSASIPLGNSRLSFRNYKQFQVGDTSSAFSFSSTDIESFTGEEYEGIPFELAGEIGAELSVAVTRAELILELGVDKTCIPHIGAGFAKYDFSLQLDVDGNIDLEGLNDSYSETVGIQTRESIINPYLLGGIDCNILFSKDVFSTIELGGRAELGNTLGYVGFGIGKHFSDNFSGIVGVRGEYHDYYKYLEYFNGFQDGWIISPYVGVLIGGDGGKLDITYSENSGLNLGIHYEF